MHKHAKCISNVISYLPAVGLNVTKRKVSTGPKLACDWKDINLQLWINTQMEPLL